MISHQTPLGPIEGSDSQHRRWRNWMLLGLLVIAIVLYAWKFDSFQVGIYMDDAEYVVLAKSIASGPSYGLINEPNSVQPTRYPFGWPLLLAPVYSLSGGNFQALKLVSFLATLANIAIIALLWQWLGLRTAWIGLATSAVYALLPLTVSHAGMVMSEAAFLTVVLVCLALTTYLGQSTQQKVVAPLLLGTIWVFTAFTRTIGITAVVACLIYLAWRRCWRTIFLSAVGLAASLILIIGITSITVTDVINVSEYQAQFSNPEGWGLANTETRIVPRALEGIDHYTRQFLRDALIPFIGGPSTTRVLYRFGVGWAPDVVGLLVTGLAIAGYCVTLRSKFHPDHFFVPAYLAILMVWPWQGDRFLYGIVPYLIAYILTTGTALVAWMVTNIMPLSTHSKVLSYRISGIILTIWLGVVVLRSAMIDSSTDHTLDLRVGTTWIRENTPSNAVVFAEQPLAVSLYAQRSTAGLLPPDDLVDQACLQPTFLLIAPKLEWHHDDQLELSTVSTNLEVALQQERIDGTMVFRAMEAKVVIYHIQCIFSKNGGKP